LFGRTGLSTWRTYGAAAIGGSAVPLLKACEIARLIFRVVDIATLEFSLAIRYSGGGCRS
jgi:hypothetical protein